jgi:hypothetical protein
MKKIGKHTVYDSGSEQMRFSGMGHQISSLSDKLNAVIDAVNELIAIENKKNEIKKL